MRKNFKNLITPYVNYTSITNRFLSSFDRFTVFTSVRGKTSKISLIRDFSAQVSPIVFSAHLTVLRLITTLWEKTLKNLISPWVQCTSITNGVLSSYDRFTSFYNCMSYNFRNLISPRVKCTKTTNRVISSFDRFTDYYNRMSKNFKNLLSPWVQCTSITNRVLSFNWPFYGFLQLYEKKIQKSHNSVC